MLHEPELLLLDEPTSAVDPESRREFWESLFELADIGTTILVSTHLMDEAERCHRLAILDHGVLVADGTPGELTGKLEGRTFIVEAADPRRAQRALVDVPGVLGVAQVGNSLRVLTGEEDASTTAATRCRDSALQMRWPKLARRPMSRRRRRISKTCSSPPRATASDGDAGARGMNWRRLWAIVVKELRQLRRDRLTLAMIVGIPMMQLLLFGYAINFALRGLDVGIADQANTAGSRALVMDMLATGVVAPVCDGEHAAGTDGR